MEKDPQNMRDVYEMMTYLLVVIVSAIVMVIGLKRRSKRKRK